MTSSTRQCTLNMTKVAREKEPAMVAMAGKYIVYIKKSRLVLEHPAGVRFDLTQEDATELAVLVSNWQLAMGVGPYKYQADSEANEKG